MFNGLTHPSSGEIRIHGEPIRVKDPIALRRHIGYVQQDAGLLPHWTVEENIGLVPLLLGWEPKRRTSRVHALLDLVHLDPHQFRARYPIELSGGQRQRVAFARALAADPEIVLLDEPFGALDAITRHELQRQFLGLKQHLKKTMVMVTHDIDEALQLGDRIAVLKEGHLLQIGTPDRPSQHPSPRLHCAIASPSIPWRSPMIRPLHSMCFVALVFFVLLPLPAFSQEDRIVVGSKNFMENKLLGEIFAQLIEARTDLSVERRLGLAGTQVCFEALRTGAIDLYPEYTGTGLVSILQQPPTGDSRTALNVVRSEFLKRWDLWWLNPLGFENAYALAVPRSRTAGTPLRTHFRSRQDCAFPDGRDSGMNS